MRCGGDRLRQGRVARARARVARAALAARSRSRARRRSRRRPRRGVTRAGACARPRRSRRRRRLGSGGRLRDGAPTRRAVHSARGSRSRAPARARAALHVGATAELRRPDSAAARRGGGESAGRGAPTLDACSDGALGVSAPRESGSASRLKKSRRATKRVPRETCVARCRRGEDAAAERRSRRLLRAREARCRGSADRHRRHPRGCAALDGDGSALVLSGPGATNASTAGQGRRARPDSRERGAPRSPTRLRPRRPLGRAGPVAPRPPRKESVAAACHPAASPLPPAAEIHFGPARSAARRGVRACWRFAAGWRRRRQARGHGGRTSKPADPRRSGRRRRRARPRAQQSPRGLRRSSTSPQTDERRAPRTARAGVPPGGASASRSRGVERDDALDRRRQLAPAPSAPRLPERRSPSRRSSPAR